MSTYDPNSDPDKTTDWPTNRPFPPPGDDAEATRIVPPRGGTPTPPPTSPVPPPGQTPYGAPATGWTPPPAPQGAPGSWQPPAPPGHYPPPGYPTGSPGGTPPGGKKPWGLILGALAVVILLVGGGMFVLGGGSLPFTSKNDETATASDKSGTDADDADDSESGSSSDSGTKSKSESGEDSPSKKSGSTSASPTAEAPATSSDGTIDPASLSTLLASVSDLNERLDANLSPVGALQTQPFSGMTVQPTNCAGALLPGIDTVYRGEDITGFSGQILTDDASNTAVMQSVIAFNSDSDATTFFNKQFGAWQNCKFTDILASGGGQTQKVKTAAPGDTDGTATLIIFPGDSPSGSGRSCQRGMSPRNNVIVDVRVCSPNNGSKGFTLARDIGAKITGKR